MIHEDINYIHNWKKGISVQNAILVAGFGVCWRQAHITIKGRGQSQKGCLFSFIKCFTFFISSFLKFS